MDDSASNVSSLDTSRKTALNSCTAPDAEPEDMCPQGVLLNSRTTGQLRKKIVRTREHHREEHKRSQDQPQFSHINNLCLHCAGDHQSHDCPTRQQHQANTTSNSTSGPGIYQNINKFANTSHTSPQSQSTIGITTPTLPVTSPTLQHNFQHPPPINPQLHYQAWPPHFQQFTQPQASPLQTSPQPSNSATLLSKYPPSNSPLVDSNDSSILVALQKQWERQERLDKEHFDMERQKEERKRMKEE